MSLLPLVGSALIALGDGPVEDPAPPVAEIAVQASPLDLLNLLDLDFTLGRWTFHGYVQFDGATYDQAPQGPPETDFRRGGVHRGDPLRARSLDDGTNLRRARLGGEGSFGQHIAYRAMFELGANGAQGESRVAEVWVNYSRFAPYSIRAGAFPQPINMEDATGSDSTLFLERATAADLSRSLGAGDGRIGVTVKRSDPRWMAAVSLTGPQIDGAEDFSPRAGLVWRVSRAVNWTPGLSTHVGLNGAYVLSAEQKKAPGAPAGFPVRLLNTPEIDVDDTALIDTGDILADRAHVLGLEFTAQRRNLFLQAEAFRFGVERTEPGLSDPVFGGFYVQGSWILTGETRRFDQSRGAFVFPKVQKPIGGGGWGAWELAFRYSRMDLNHHEGRPGQIAPLDGVRGGEQSILGAALLWYPRPRVRVMVNYLHVEIDRLNPAGPADLEPFGPPPATPPAGVQIGQSMNILAVRGRYAF